MRAWPFLAIAATSCVTAPPRRPPVHEPPASVLVVTDGRVSLRASAYVELHVMLANMVSADRSDVLEPAELDAAQRAYGRASRVELDRIARALAACTDDACAHAAMKDSWLGPPFARALPHFVKRQWPERSQVAWHALEVAQTSLGPEDEAIFTRAASELSIRWEEPVPIPFTTETLATQDIVPLAISARGPCIARGSAIVDCILVHALLPLASPIHEDLVKKLGDDIGERAWKVLVVHTVASIFSNWQAKHRSVYGSSAAEGERQVWQSLEAVKGTAGYAEFWERSHPRPQ